MTSEQRLDRLERIAKLFVRAGLRARSGMREQDEKINIIITAQRDNESRFAKFSSELFRSNDDLAQSLTQSHRELAQSHNELAKAQTRTEEHLSSLIETIRRERNGDSN